jgi:predicted amidohydrolase YtcJ
MVITAIETALAHTPRVDPRPRIEHCSLLHPEQMKRIAMAGITLSFLMDHVYYFGRYFRDEILGPCASAAKHGILFTLHSGTTV